ncbi:hypothetical protein I7I51_07691 [Histoplasma capsulatum]|uniref:Uncharacterized protein n=1 Tax=Ajellomyces capsulatus TaxID=5037 RepID=A0A8A1LVR0_AJECA|nr:hypothetical protein I7I51_07691 [Histoplasma capsulatum]
MATEIGPSKSTIILEPSKNWWGPLVLIDTILSLRYHSMYWSLSMMKKPDRIEHLSMPSPPDVPNERTSGAKDWAGRCSKKHEIASKGKDNLSLANMISQFRAEYKKNGLLDPTLNDILHSVTVEFMVKD